MERILKEGNSFSATELFLDCDLDTNLKKKCVLLVGFQGTYFYVSFRIWVLHVLDIYHSCTDLQMA